MNVDIELLLFAMIKAIEALSSNQEVITTEVMDVLCKRHLNSEFLKHRPKEPHAMTTSLFQLPIHLKCMFYETTDV